MRSITLLLLMAVFSIAAPVPKEVKNRPDAFCFVGTWDTTTSESNGKPYSKARWTFDETLKMISTPLPGEAGGSSEWVIAIDPTKSPKEINIGVYPGIYEFVGAEIQIAYTLGGGRPTKLNSANGQYYTILRLVPEAKK